jgi:hypothetical protein
MGQRKGAVFGRVSGDNTTHPTPLEDLSGWTMSAFHSGGGGCKGKRRGGFPSSEGMGGGAWEERDSFQSCQSTTPDTKHLWRTSRDGT